MNAFFETDHNLPLSYYRAHNTRCSPHFHSRIELYIVHEGKQSVTINNQNKVLKKGEMSIALPYDIHTYQNIGDSLTSCLIIPDDMAMRFRMMIDKKQPSSSFITDQKTVQAITELINKIQPLDHASLSARGYVYIILDMIYNHLKFSAIQQKINPELSSKILFYLEENFKENLSLEKASVDLGYSTYYMSRFFNQHFQCNFSDYVNMLRLRNFVNILKENNFNITYCAYESGFTSIRTFNRAFKKEFDTSPKEYIAKAFKKDR